MRILVISNLYPPVVVGGYEARCAHTTEWLARRHEMLVLTSRRGRRRAGQDPLVLRELPFLSDDTLGSLRAPLASLRAVRVMRRILRSFRPDLVFVWNAAQIPRAALRLAQDRGVAVAFSLADPWLEAFVTGDQFLRHLAPGDRGARRVWAAALRLVNRLPGMRIELATPRPAALVWNSRALRSATAIPIGLEPVLERVIYPATLNENLYMGVVRKPAPTPTIAFVGRIEWEKAPDLACRALALLRDRHGIDAELMLVGTGKARARRELVALVRELAIDDRVQLRGWLAPEEVADVLSQAHAVVVPSRWQEPFGLVCLEAALARVPIVASLSGGMPEMLASEEEALFFPIDDAEACAAALARTLREPEQADRRVRAALARARGYSLEHYRAEYEAFVEDATRAGATDSTLHARAPM
jgi:glycosyltransferase involved in cell wall biosynthesis